MKSVFSTRLRYGVSALVLAGLHTIPLHQTAQAQEAEEGMVFEEVVVTGSRIARKELTSVSPVSVMGSEEIKLSGNVNIERVLNELPQVMPALTSSSNNPGNGTATIDLRGLGSNRTLVLVNGRRHVPTTLDGIVDINQIPTSLVERVEVVTGGASAVYGSDAISGVVNFIYKDDFEGVELDASYDMTAKGDAEIFNTSVTLGSNFADDRGNAVLYVGYNKRNGLFAGERDFGEQALGDSAYCYTGTTPSVLEPCGSSRVPSTFADNLGVSFVNGEATPNIFTGNVPAWTDPDAPADPYPFGYNYMPVNYLQLPQERFSAAALGHYDINEHVTAYAEISFVQHNTPQQLAPTPAEIKNFHFNYADNPYLTDGSKALFATLDDGSGKDITAGDGTVFLSKVRRRLLENGPRLADSEFSSLRIVTGLKGDVDDNWNYDVSVNYGRVVNSNALFNDASSSRFINGLNAGVANDGSVRCLSQLDPDGNYDTSLDPSCVPVNIWGDDSMTEDMVAYTAQDSLARITYEQFIVEGIINGTIAELPAGDLGVAFGASYREENATGAQDWPSASGDLLGFNAQVGTDAGYHVSEVFGEVVIPILSDTAGAELLEASGALRYSDYSSVGSVWTYAGGLTWQPISDIRIRGQYQRAVRAPNINELFGGESQGFPSYRDPCNSANGLTPEQEAFCVAWGVPAGLIDTFSQGDSQTEVFFTSSPDLQEEVTDTFTLGAVIQPSAVEGLNVTIDYYNIKLSDAIGLFGGSAQGNINGCFASMDLNSQYCQNSILRNPLGDLEANRIGSANLATAKTEGIDFQIDYSFEVDGMGIGEEPATLGIMVRGNYLMTMKFQSEEGQDFLECAGIYACWNNPFALSGTSPEWKATTRFSYASGPFQFNIDWRYIGSMKSSDFSDDPTLQVGDDTGQVPENQEIGAWNYFDLSMSYQATDNVNIYGGVENIFDKKPPLIGELYGIQNNTDPSTYDTLGTRFYFGVTTRF
ncbi:TonB-dependent receptor plug domain-containing protein [Emcibacter nanhaiensis]|uniref:TonB-dependent receptor n=1 Tax=Emcibacter nanhaiensis TaxID=1505037 RepID=A0A501PFU3_9PROT|nr:TonB-dependent receptor [Emcibacter nanhaiensis]TPD58907.1 hypothetical protein FIV46_13565 [Emcibacter nanhaiensis]